MVPVHIADARWPLNAPHVLLETLSCSDRSLTLISFSSLYRLDAVNDV